LLEAHKSRRENSSSWLILNKSGKRKNIAPQQHAGWSKSLTNEIFLPDQLDEVEASVSQPPGNRSQPT